MPLAERGGPHVVRGAEALDFDEFDLGGLGRTVGC